MRQKSREERFGKTNVVVNEDLTCPCSGQVRGKSESLICPVLKKPSLRPFHFHNHFRCIPTFLGIQFPLERTPPFSKGGTQGGFTVGASSQI
jgi:hypothetical protein